MKKFIITILCSVCCIMLATHTIYAQADDGVCDVTTTVDPITPTPDPPPATACSNGTNVPTFGTANGSLPDAEFVVEINGVIDDINATGVPATAPVDGDVVCVTAFTYDLAAIDGLLNTANGLCPTLDIIVGAAVCGPIGDLIAGNNDGTPGLNSLQEALDFAGTFGTPIVGVGDAITTLDALNVQLELLGQFVCYATSAPVCYTIDDSDPACQDAGPCDGIDLTAAPGAPTVPTESTCEADGMTLSGGALDFAASTCPAGSTLEYSTDGGAAWSTTAPMYDQMNAITVTVRCTCDADMTISSPTAEVTTVPGVCDGGGDGCTVDAGEPTPTTADVCDTDLGAVDVTAVFADPGVPGTPSLNQNYVIVDPTSTPPNDIISVSSTAVLDLTGLAVGDQACVVSVAYTQETLDIVTAFLDMTLAGICVPIVGTPCASDFIGPFGTLDLSGFLNGLNGAFETFGFNFTSDDIALWCINQEITLPLSAIPGGLFDDLVIDLTTIPGLEPDGFCCDFSTDSYCLTVVQCACAIEAELATAPAAPTVVESTCEADGMTLSGGSIDYAPTMCPAGSTMQFSTDGGATWVPGPGPTYDQTNAITFSIRCLCDEDMMTASPVTDVTTVPGMCDDPAACAIEADLAAAPAAPTVTESVCGADGMTLEGGSIDYAPTMCPAGSTMQFSTDGGATWGPGPGPAYDQTNAISFSIRCLCDEDMMTASPVTDVTTVPGTCDGGGDECSITISIINFVCNDNGTPEDDTDDYYTYDIEVNGSNIGGTGDYMGADGVGGSFTGNQANFPETFTGFSTQGGAGATGSIMVDATSVDDPACTASDMEMLAPCNLVPQIPTLSQWGLMSLALLLMIFGSLKLGFSTTFNTVRKKN